MVNFKQKNQPAVKVSPGIVNVRRSVIAAAVSVVLTLLAVLVFSLFAFLDIVPESFIPALSVIVTLAGGFFSGYLIALSVPSMGLVNGLCAGAFYFVIMFVLSSIFAPGFSINKTFFINLLISVISAGVGGIVSINLRASRRSRKRRKR